MKHTRTTTKKILSVLLALLMVILSVPFAFAEGENAPEVLLSGEYGTITWSLTDDGTLTVGGTGAIEPMEPMEGEETGLFPWDEAILQLAGLESEEEAYASVENFEAYLDEVRKVTSIVVEEGVTAIPDGAFSSFNPEKISIASTVSTIGIDAFQGSFATEITIKNPNFSFADDSIELLGYLGEEPQFQTPDELRDAVLALERGELRAATRIFAYFQMALLIVNAQYYNGAYFEQLKQSLVYQAENYGIFAQNYDELVTIILTGFNDELQTNFTDISELFVPVDYESTFGHVVEAPELAQALYGDFIPDVFFQSNLIVYLGKSLIGRHQFYTISETGETIYYYSDGPVTVYPWLTVYGYEGSTAQAAAEASGVNFALIGEAPSDPTDPHVHSYLFSGEITRTPTCIDPGEGIYTCECGESETREIGIDPTNHVNTENKAAVASTCTVKGFTAGVYCNDCETWVSGHEEAALDTTNHVNTENKAAVASTCTVKGFTAGVYCNDCKTWVSGHEEAALDTTNHVNTENKAAVASNCKETGFTAGVYCNDCKTWVSGHEVVGVDASKHAELNENGDCTRCGKHVKDIETPTEPTTDSDNEPDSGRPGLITRIIDWFRNLFAKILSFFGLKK